MSERKKYNHLENTLIEINRRFISLPDDEIKRNNKLLESILSTIIDKMKEQDQMFKAMYRRVFYGGSYYDGLRITKPEEFDLDLLLTLPQYTLPELTSGNIPGFVHLKVTNYDGWLRQPEAMPAYRNFRKLFDDDFFLDTGKVLAWIEGILQKVLNSTTNSGGQYTIGQCRVTVQKSGPALTLKVITEKGVKLDVDLVPCFVFTENRWPKNGFKPNPVKAKSEFFIVPKKPKGQNGKTQHYWRLSFQEQERVLMDNKRTLKPTIKLLKKLRDNLQHKCVASYYIKTVVLNIAVTKDETFWQNSLSYVFMTILKEYVECIKEGKIPYFWNSRNNLIGGVGPATLQGMYNRLKGVIDNVEKTKDPVSLAKYLLTAEEMMELFLYISSR